MASAGATTTAVVPPASWSEMSFSASSVSAAVRSSPGRYGCWVTMMFAASKAADRIGVHLEVAVVQVTNGQAAPGEASQVRIGAARGEVNVLVLAERVGHGEEEIGGTGVGVGDPGRAVSVGLAGSVGELCD